jgi:MFS transporter, UMF1 family
MLEKNHKKTIHAWAFYDWANSVYSLVITTAIFPIYYSSITSTEAGDNIVSFFGINVRNTVLYEYSLSFSFLFVAAVAPLLSGIADYGGKRKFFMKTFTYIGSMSCMMLFFFEQSNVEFGIIFAAMASIGFSGSLVFYNSYLPVIATPDKFDKVSAKGFSLGYIGSVILLIINLIMIFQGEALFGITDATFFTRISFVMVGLWWAGFAQYSFKYLPENKGHFNEKGNILIKGYQEIIKIWGHIRKLKHLKRFIYAYFFYNTGVQTTIYLASLFGATVLGLPMEMLILTILIIQLVAIAGAYFFAYLSSIKGNRFSLLVMIILWIGVCISAYFITSQFQFFAVALVVGIVMGGIQSLSRATYSKFIPQDTTDQTSYFSFYDVTEKISLVMGTMVYAFVDQVTGSMRTSSLMLALFFIIGYFILLTVKVPESKTRKL